MTCSKPSEASPLILFFHLLSQLEALLWLFNDLLLVTHGGDSMRLDVNVPVLCRFVAFLRCRPVRQVHVPDLAFLLPGTASFDLQSRWHRPDYGWGSHGVWLSGPPLVQRDWS